MKSEIFKSKRALNYLIFLKYIVFILISFILSRAGIKNNIFPFDSGFYIATVWCNQNIFIMSLIFLLTSFLTTFELKTLIINGFIIIFITIVYFIHKQLKKPIKLWLLCIYSVIANFALIYYYCILKGDILTSFVSIFFTIIFMLACIKIFKTLLVRGVAFKLTIDETISLCLFLAVLSLGLNTITIFNIELVKVFAIFMILLTTYIYNGSVSVCVGVVLGLGQALNSGNFIMCGAFSLFGLVSLTFKTSHPYYSVLSILLLELIYGLFFNIYGEYNVCKFLSVLIGVILFLLTNKTTLQILKVLLGGETNLKATRNVVNRSRDNLCKRMFEISNIFNDMDKVYRSMVKGVLPVDEAKRMLTQEVMQKVCADCPERHKCLRVLADETSKVFDDIVSAGFERGKATILDVPPFLTTRCNKVNVLLNAINQLIVSYKQYADMVKSMDTSRILIADQLSGISGLLKTLAIDTQKNITFDTEKENRIIDELNYFNIIASEVVLYEKDTETTNITMVVREKDKDNQNILKVISKICGYKMVLVSSLPSETPNFVVNEYRTAPKYDVVYGSSGCPKLGNQVSGDSYSFIKLSNDKVLLAICDGMGSGENAQKTSDIAISLIENFYKAGFDNEIILNSVNRFLSLNGDENYSALDLCVIDLKNSNVDFVKVGAPDGLIKHKTSTEILKSGALPLGILDEMKPVISKKIVESSDMIVLCSDGVIDSFGGTESLQNYVNNSATTNPQTLSQMIIDEALLKCKNEPQDDCTCICARVYNRV